MQAREPLIDGDFISIPARTLELGNHYTVSDPILERERKTPEKSCRLNRSMQHHLV